MRHKDESSTKLKGVEGWGRDSDRDEGQIFEGW